MNVYRQFNTSTAYTLSSVFKNQIVPAHLMGSFQTFVWTPGEKTLRHAERDSQTISTPAQVGGVYVSAVKYNKLHFWRIFIALQCLFSWLNGTAGVTLFTVEQRHKLIFISYYQELYHYDFVSSDRYGCFCCILLVNHITLFLSHYCCCTTHFVIAVVKGDILKLIRHTAFR